MSAMVSFGIRRWRRPSSERWASVGISERARAPTSVGSGSPVAICLAGSMAPSAADVPHLLFSRGQIRLGVAREPRDQHIGRYDIAEHEVKRAQRSVMVLVGHGGVAVGHHDRLEIEHHGVKRRRIAAHVGYRAGDKIYIDAARATDFGTVRLD